VLAALLFVVASVELYFWLRLRWEDTKVKKMFWLRFVWPQTGFLAVEGAWQGSIWGTDSFHFPRVAKGKIALAMWGTGPVNMAHVYFEFPHGVATAMGISNFRYGSHFITKVFRSFPDAFSESFPFMCKIVKN